jgi:Holliday junction resolvasome RuvABC endonuclease subunit
MRNIVIGLDPGTGISSPTGFAAFDPDAQVLLHAQEVWTSKQEFSERIKEIADQVEELLFAIDPDVNVTVYVESFVMRGKGGEMLARLTGALMASVPDHCQPVATIQNTTVKKIVGGHGRADKAEVANGVHTYFQADAESRERVQAYINAKLFDVLDALAIGIAGHLRATKQAE